MVKVMQNDKLGYKVVIWAFFGISLWTERVALINNVPLPATIARSKYSQSTPPID